MFLHRGPPCAEAAPAMASVAATVAKRSLTHLILLQERFKLHKKIPNTWAGLEECAQITYVPVQAITSLDLSLRFICNFR